MKTYKRVLGCFEQLEYRTLLSVSAGDANLDGVVNLADINAVIANYDQVGDWSKGDFDGDGKVSEADLSTALNHYGNYGATIKATANENGDVAIMVVPNPDPVQTVVKMQLQSDASNDPTDAYFTANIGQYAAGTHTYSITGYDSLGNPSDPYTGSFDVFMAGDATKDGTVDTIDLTLVLDHYNQVGDWSTGDFNDDGMVNVADLTALLNNYNKTAPMLGDANLDRILDATDFSIVTNNFNTPGDWSKGDFNADGMVDQIDLNILSAHFNILSGTGRINNYPSEVIVTATEIDDDALLVENTTSTENDQINAALLANAENTTEKKDETVKSNKGGGGGAGYSPPIMQRSQGLGGYSAHGKVPFSQAVDRRASDYLHASTISDHTSGNIVGFDSIHDLWSMYNRFWERK